MSDITKLHPEVRVKCEKLISACTVNGLPIKITQTLRTVAQQEALYAQGRTAPGNIVTNARGLSYSSPHQWGVAFDFCKNVKGQEYSDIPFFQKVGALGKTLGLFWGGDFRGFVDMPHFEDVKFFVNNSAQTLRSKYGTPEKFISTWGQYNNGIEKTVANLISDGVAADKEHWRGFLYGISTTRPDYVRTIFDRYHNLLKKGG